MVSNDGRVLIADFGFSTVGYFGAPPGVARTPSPTAVNNCAKPSVPNLLNGEIPTSDIPIPGTPIGENKGRSIGEGEQQESTDNILYGTLKGYTPRYQSPEICTIMNEKAALVEDPHEDPQVVLYSSVRGWEWGWTKQGVARDSGCSYKSEGDAPSKK